MEKPIKINKIFFIFFYIYQILFFGNNYFKKKKGIYFFACPGGTCVKCRITTTIPTIKQTIPRINPIRQKIFFLSPLTPRIPIIAKTIAIIPKTIPVKPAKINPTIAKTIATIPITSATVKLLPIIKTPL